MKVFIYIIVNNIIPIFLIIMLGYWLEKKFAVDINSFNKANFYVFMPALILAKVYNTSIDISLLKAILFGLLIILLNYLLAIIIAKIRRYKSSRTNAFKNSLMFYNAGNFGIPLIILVFKDSPMAVYAVSIQIMILMVQSFAIAIGFYNAGRGQMSKNKTIKSILKMPFIYMVVIALFIKIFPYDFTKLAIWSAIDYTKGGLIPVALLTLGIQISRARLNFKDKDVYIASLMRLIGGPVLAYLLIKLMGIQGIMAQVLFISSSVPTAVNTALVAVEYNNEPDYSSQVVLTTTLLSTVTLPFIIYFSDIIF